MAKTIREVVRDALKRMLPKQGAGNFAYATFFEGELISQLCDGEPIAISGWELFGIIASQESRGSLIGADRAVELREEKGQNIILLIDPTAALSGMDGIYSAGMQIKEQEFFKRANDLAIAGMKQSVQRLAKKAVEKARRIGRQHTVSPWDELRFYVALANEPSGFGRFIADLSLWPISHTEELEETDLDKSARLVERLLLATGSAKTPSMRITSLALKDATDQQIKQLEQFVRHSTSMSWKEAVDQLRAEPKLWLNEIKPALFESDEIKEIELIKWRARPDSKPAVWSGLSLSDAHAGMLRIAVNPTPATAKERSKLEVRWKAIPEGLKAGAVEYSVSIIAGDDMLAEQRLVHDGRETQKCKFTEDDFVELEEGSTFEARIIVRVLGMDFVPEGVTEDFILTIGKEEKGVRSGTGQELRCLVEGFVTLDKETFESAVSGLSSTGKIVPDKKGFLVARAAQKSFRVKQPALMTQIETQWAAQNGQLGRWIVRVTPDGNRYGEPEFVPFQPGNQSDNLWQRIADASSAFCKHFCKERSVMAHVYAPNKYVDEYINAWSAGYESCPPELLLANTAEVKSISGRSIGLIVLPTHPSRVAWHYAYDCLVQHARFEDGVAAKLIEPMFGNVTGAYYPFLLPGLTEGESFVFGDMLGFFFVGMIDSKDPEPKAALAVLAKSLSDEASDIAPWLGVTTGKFLGREVQRYMELHEDYHNLCINAVKAGDGRTVAMALGMSLLQSGNDDFDNADLMNKGFTLCLQAGSSESAVTGSYLIQTSEKRRVGAAGVGRGDRWMLESYSPHGGESIPRLRWAKVAEQQAKTPGHLSFTFDTFGTVISGQEQDSELRQAPLELYGLIPPIRRDFIFSPSPVWRTYLAPHGDGDKHPANRTLTDRLIRLHTNTMRAVARNIGSAGMPVLETRLSPEDEDRLRTLHAISDWVITIDRNGGIEYFDSPKEARQTYEAYVIDCVPERPSLGTMQLVTSTSHLDELINLLGNPLSEMGLSCSPRNCEFLLSNLKGLSGRLAMKLANQGHQPGELVALSLLYANCLSPEAGASAWCDLRDGFFVPLDDVPELLPTSRGLGSKAASALRADLVYVMLPKRGPLQFAFLESKFRRYLRTSRAPELLDLIEAQLKSTSKHWEENYFRCTGSVTEIDINRYLIGRILRFYAAKANRHHLRADMFAKIERELDKFVTQGSKYAIQRLPDKGLIFCPEYTAPDPERLVHTGEGEIYLFGPHQMPDLPMRYTTSGYPSTPKRDTDNDSGPAPASDQDSQQSDSSTSENAETPDAGQALGHILQDIGRGPSDASEGITMPQSPAPPTSDALRDRPLAEAKLDREAGAFKILLGEGVATGQPMYWEPSTSTNPHLMIVGLPGMGKTTALINVTRQIFEQGGNPIVFSYHEDFDGRLPEQVGTDNITFIDFNGLGFNPLRVVSPKNPLAYLDNASNLRDIFAAVFPEMGDLQIERIREAIKRSYLELGWGGTADGAGDSPATPEFQRFFELLAEQEKSGSGLIARLSELNDYGFFKNIGSTRSALDNKGVTVVRLHGTKNEYLQRAFGSFVLYNIYQEMFVRGIQPQLRNAVIFDEAHKASKLKLLGTMGKECRKYGIALLVASQEVKDFNSSLFAAISNYLLLRLTDVDAKIAAKYVAPSEMVSRIADKLKNMEKWHGYFFTEALRRPELISLAAELGTGR